mgnify:CR=1 FL=1
MNLRSTIGFKEQDKHNQINFFKVKKPVSLQAKLFETYLKWLFKSTLDLQKKLALIKDSKTESAIIKAVETLRKNYCVNRIPKRNSELNAFLSNTVHPP